MATHLGKRNAVLPIHFFKIILETNVERMKIPNKFTSRYGGGLSNPVCLRTPDLIEWEVHWTKENGEVWFEKGWKIFVESYSLDCGHLVLFKYEGTSQIDVIILDQSALEIDYPLSDSDDEMGTLDQSDDESVKIVKVTSAEQSARPKSPFVSFLSCKRTRSGTLGNIMKRNSNPQNLHANAGIHSDQVTKFQKNTKHQPEGVKVDQRTTSLNTPKPIRAQVVAKKFVSTNLFFTVIIKASQLEENASKHVPKFLDIVSKVKSVMLKIGNRSWNVKMFCGSNRYYDRFGSGWSLFAKESKLQAGDICIFELIDPNDLLFEVHVTKASSS